MRVGIIGLGHIGHPIASRLHSLNHEVHSWTRSARLVPWTNFTNFDSSVDTAFDSIFIASGGTKPNIGDQSLEVSTTYDLISKFTISKSTKLFFISSGSVYGECQSPQTELDKPMPTTDYGRAKLFAEKKLRSKFGDQLSILRVGNVIDETNPYGVVAQLQRSIQLGTFEVLGQPSDCRDYIEISDLLSCIEQLVQEKSPAMVLNLGSGRPISLEQITDLIQEICENQIRVIWKGRRPGDLSQTKLNVNKMRSSLNVNPIDPIKRLEDIFINLCL